MTDEISNISEEIPQSAPVETTETAVEAPEKSEEEKALEQKQQEYTKGVQKRINELTFKAREAERQAQAEREYNQRLLTMLEGKQQAAQQAAPAGEPTRDQYDDYEEYIVARAEYRAEQKAQAHYQKSLEDLDQRVSETRAQAHQRQVNETWNQQIETAETKYADYAEVVANAYDLVVPTEFAEGMKQSEQGTDISYYLAKNPREVTRIQGLQGLQLYKELGRLEAKLSAVAAPISNAPTPIRPVGSGSAPRDPNKMDDSEWMKWRWGEIKKRG